MNNDEIKKKWAKLVAKAWADEKFKKKLLENPNEVCKEYGITMPGMDYQIVENTKSKCYLVLPMKPNENLSVQDLKKIAAAEGSGNLCGCVSIQ